MTRFSCTLCIDEHGNFLPLLEWKPGHPKPPKRPLHIYPPKKEVSLGKE